MTATIEINKDVIDVAKETLPYSELTLLSYGIKYTDLPFSKLEVGQSFVVRIDKQSWCFINTMAACAKRYSKNTEKKFKCKQIDDKKAVECLRIY